MGWLDLKEVGNASAVTLQSPIGLAENSAYIIRNSSSETFIFENRQPDTWYPTSFGSGVLVTRIAYNQRQWSYNTLNNTQSKKRACVLTANGAKLYYSASSSNLYGNGSKTSIASLKTWSGSTKEIGIKSIVKNSDGTIKLVFDEGGDTPDDPTPDPKPTPEGTIFYESFDQCNGKGGNDGSWENITITSNLIADNEGWEASDDKAYGASKCARFGTGKVSGSATTPAFTLTGGAVLTFKAGAWNGTNDGTTLTLSAEGGTVSPESVMMTKGAFSDYTVNVIGTGSMTLTFTSLKGRFFLDEVKVESVVTEISIREAAAVQNNRIYTLDGRYAGGTLENLPRGLYIVNGKKVAVRK